MSKIGLIIQREYATRVKKRTFIVLTILVPIIIVGLLFLAVWMGTKENKITKVLVSDPRGLCNGDVYIGADEGPAPATFDFYEDIVDSLQFQTEEQFKDYDVLIALNPQVITNKQIHGYYREEPSSNTQIYIRRKLELRLEEYFAISEGLSLEKFREIRSPFKFVLKGIDDNEASRLTDQRQAVGLGFSIFIFMFILVYSAQVMRSVIEEKTSRVVEIIVSSVKPFQLMMGKIIAVGLVGLTQFLIWIGLILLLFLAVRLFIFPDMTDPSNMVALNGMSQMGNMPAMENEIIELVFNQINWSLLIGLFLVYFIGGYLLYGSLFAMIGSAVDSETDTQQLMIPVIMPLTFTYIISIMIQGNSDGPAAVWFSQIPFCSPIIMLQRVAAGTVSGGEVVLSLFLLAATFVLTTYLAAKIYRVGILMYGKKASWREIIKWMKH